MKYITCLFSNTLTVAAIILRSSINRNGFSLSGNNFLLVDQAFTIPNHWLVASDAPNPIRLSLYTVRHASLPCKTCNCVSIPWSTNTYIIIKDVMYKEVVRYFFGMGTGGHKEMSSILRPRIWHEPKCGGWGGLSNEYSCAHGDQKSFEDITQHLT
jgi:hypothetical protein